MAEQMLNASVIAKAWSAIMAEAFRIVHMDNRRVRMEFWTKALLDYRRRDFALSVLAKDNEIHQELGPVLCRSPAVVLIIQEVLAVCPLLKFPNFLEITCKRTCSALILLKCVASHPDTRRLLLDAKVMNNLMPLLAISECSAPNEHLRFSCLGVISALLQDDDEELVKRLLKTKLFPDVLHCLTRGHEYTKTVAAYIVFRILEHETGISYICTIPDRFFVLCYTLKNVFSELGLEPDRLLLGSVVGCYLRLSEHPRACDGLLIWLPRKLLDNAWIAHFNDEPTIAEWTRHIRENVAHGHYNRSIVRRAIP